MTSPLEITTLSRLQSLETSPSVSPTRASPLGISQDAGSIESATAKTVASQTLQKPTSTVERWENILQAFITPILRHTLSNEITTFEELIFCIKNGRAFDGFLYDAIDNSAQALFNRVLTSKERVDLKLDLEFYIKKCLSNAEMPRLAQAIQAWSQKAKLSIDASLFLPNDQVYPAVVIAALMNVLERMRQQLQALHEKSPELILTSFDAILPTLQTKSNFLEKTPKKSQNFNQFFTTLHNSCYDEIYEYLCAWAEEFMRESPEEKSAKDNGIKSPMRYSPKELALWKSFKLQGMKTSAGSTPEMAEVKNFAMGLLPKDQLDSLKLGAGDSNIVFYAKLQTLLGSNNELYKEHILKSLGLKGKKKLNDSAQAVKN